MIIVSAADFRRVTGSAVIIVSAAGCRRVTGSAVIIVSAAGCRRVNDSIGTLCFLNDTLSSFSSPL